MKVVGIDDENLALEKLARYLLKYDSSLEIVVTLSSIKESVNWFEKNTDYNVVFMDIQLTDGLSFEIFNQTKMTKPVIFTTAFDEYAIDAFKVNSIDYILKPITFTDVSKAMNKLKMLQNVYAPINIEKVVDSFEKKKIKNRFLVRLGNHIHSILSEDILLFYAEGRTVFLVTNEHKKFIIDFTLEELYQLLDLQLFFRVNRSFIVQINAIKDVVIYSNSRLKIRVSKTFEKEIIVSREKVSSFKKWFEES